jgi:hypothetical protein
VVEAGDSLAGAGSGAAGPTGPASPVCLGGSRPNRWPKYRNVETFKGVVQLRGFVRPQADIDQAVKVARRVAGVKSVKNDMRIK